MNWIGGLQKAIDYIEANLTEPLDYAEIARQAYSSSFHFQRVFSLLCGCTLGEYIRSRRLTLAGAELASAGGRVIDAALKYGYDTPGSFSRAFTRFHGVTPVQARAGAGLRSYSRLSVKLILAGGTTMEYRIEKRGPVRIAAKKERFPAGEVTFRQISGLWERCRRDGTIEKLCGVLTPEPFGDAIVGACFDDPAAGDYDYAVCAACKEGPVPEGLSAEEIPAGTWAVFPCKGAMPDALQALCRQVYTEFFPASEYQPACGLFLEVYPGDNVTSADFTCQIWVSVEKRER